MEIYVLIGALGLISGFLSGLLGIGGGIVMAPLLLYAPPLFGLEPLSMQIVAGLTIVQGLVGCVAGSLTHKKFNFVSIELSLHYTKRQSYRYYHNLNLQLLSQILDNPDFAEKKVTR